MSFEPSTPVWERVSVRRATSIGSISGCKAGVMAAGRSIEDVTHYSGARPQEAVQRAAIAGARTTGQPAPARQLRLDATRPGCPSRLGVRSAELCTAIYSSSGSRHKCEHIRRTTSIYMRFLSLYVPCAMVLRLTSCSSRRTALLPPSSAGHLPANLTPAPRRPNHTTSPYASGAYVYRALSVHRISPRVRDDRERPSSAVRQAGLCG